MSVDCLILNINNNDTPSTEPQIKTAGPFRIATELRNAGYTVQVIDVSIFTEFNTILKKILKKFIGKNTLWVGLSVNFAWNIFGYKYFETQTELDFWKKTTPDYDKQLLKFINFCKGINPSIKFLIGGIRVYDLSEYGFIHFRGHTDEQIVEFTNKLAQENNFKFPSVIYNKEFKNFSKSSIHYTKNDIFSGDKTLPLEVARGCIFKCKFCNYPLNGKIKGEWVKDYNILYDELIYNYETFGVTNYIIVDDTYNDSITKMTDLQNKVFSRLPFKFSFVSYIRLDLIYRFPETAYILKDSGLSSAVVGIETLNPIAAKNMGKGVDPMKLIAFLHKLRETVWNDITVYSGWILGLPTDTKESLTNFSKWVISDDNPCNANGFHEMRITPPEYKTMALYQSEYDLTFEKHGFEFNIDNKGHPAWKMKNGDLDEKWCHDLIYDIRNIVGKSWQGSFVRKNDRISGFSHATYQNLGILSEDLTNMNTSDLVKKYPINDLIKKWDIEYYKKLMKINI